MTLFHNLGNIYFYPRIFDLSNTHDACSMQLHYHTIDKLMMNLDSRRETERAQKEIIISGETLTIHNNIQTQIST